jgi:hypothetical protein
VRKKKVADGEDAGRHALNADSHAAGPGPTTQTVGKDTQGIDEWRVAQNDPSWAAEESAGRTEASQSVSRRSSVALEGHIASADLLNPSDALDLLAHVADLDPSGKGKQSMQQLGRNARQDSGGSAVNYPPISDGALAYADAASLLQQ